METGSVTRERKEGQSQDCEKGDQMMAVLQVERMEVQVRVRRIESLRKDLSENEMELMVYLMCLIILRQILKLKYNLEVN